MTDKLSDLDDETKKGVPKLLDSKEKAELFLTATEKMDLDNYGRAFSGEMKILGAGHDDEAMENAKKREFKGFVATIKLIDMFEKFESDE